MTCKQDTWKYFTGRSFVVMNLHGGCFCKGFGVFCNSNDATEGVFMNKAEDAEEEMSRGFKEFWDLK